MNSLIPILSTAEHSECHQTLVDPNALMSNYRYVGKFCVAKTKIYVEPGDEWIIGLSNKPGLISLLTSSDVVVSQPTYIDVIKELGHLITIAPWQTLTLVRDVARGQSVTFLLDGEPVPVCSDS